MTEHRVIGKVVIDAVCDCPHCRGHEEEITFDKTIDVESPEAAVQKVEREYKHDYGVDFVELRGVIVLAPGEPPPLSRKAELELLKRWNEGAGLPDYPLERAV